MSNLRQATTDFIDTIRINGIARERREGRLYWVKQRRWWSNPVAHCANAFFRVAGNPVLVCSDYAAWQRWEIDSFHLLHAHEGYQAFSEGKQIVHAEQLPGEGLEAAASEGFLTEAMLAAAATELRRAHDLPCPALGGGWSHGDAHLGNFLFDAATGRARLIDFEVVHRADLPETQRRADDLLVFLQDLMGRCQAANWLPWATCFIEHYRTPSGREEVIAALRERLEPPRGISRLWWAIRTSYISPAERTRRIVALREALGSSHSPSKGN